MMAISTATIESLVKQAACEAGFDLAGISSARSEDLPELGRFPQWIARGYAGEMSYLAARDQQGRLKRAALEIALPWARSVVVCAINYNTAQPYSTECRDPRRGWISRYAWGGAEKPSDYHEVVMSRLRKVESRLREAVDPGVETRCYVDTGPIAERVYAKYAGIGWIGKNTCIINQRLGSWLFLGVIVTSLDLAPDLPPPDRCGSCTRCLDACPTQAFLAPGELDATRCISYLTIEKRGDIPEKLRPLMGRHVFGCDICQDVCPWNRRAPATSLPEFQPNPELVNPALDWLAKISKQDFQRRFRGSAIRRTKHSGFRRNTALATANSGEQAYIALLQELSLEADPVPAAHASWGLRRLESNHQGSQARHYASSAGPKYTASGQRSGSMGGPPAQSASNGNVPRRHARFRSDFRLRVSGVRDHEAFTIDGRCTALSEGGVGGILAGEMVKGDVVTLTFTLPATDTRFELRGVVRRKNGLHYGIEFLSLTEAERDAIRVYCKTLHPYR
jgi:epoxyqueuosine reductase